MKNFVNFHILHTAPYASMNRDDSGAPKTMFFGGVERVRLSSQALKRAARISFEAESAGDLSYRSKFVGTHLTSLIVDAATSAGLTIPEDKMALLRKEVEKVVSSLTGKEAKEGAGDTLVWLAEKDLVKSARRAVMELGVDGEDFAELAKAIDGTFQEESHSLSIAAFGRMFANRPDVQTEAAVQMAHAFTTHRASLELDYFTAVDDLKKVYDSNRPGAGAGHLDVSLYSTGTFYRHFNIDRRQLLRNWLDASTEGARERVAALVQSLCLSLPRGKANATAHLGFPALVYVEVATQPASYASTFETPVEPAREGGYESQSCDRLVEHADRMRRLYGSRIFGDRMILRADADGPSFSELVAWVADYLLEPAAPTDAAAAA